MSLFIVDIESDGPCPGLYSMVSLGAVRIDRDLKTTFRAEFRPVSDQFVEGALAACNLTREQTLAFPDPVAGMSAFLAFIEAGNTGGRATMVSDNIAFDWQFVNYYFHRFVERTPFGFSGRRIGDLYAGLVGDFGGASGWKSLRPTTHTHDPLDDAMGNAEALIAIADKHGLKLPGL